MRTTIKNCKVEGCANGRPIRRGWCVKHYGRWYQRGTIILTRELHGRYYTREYKLWQNIKNRTSNTNAPDYHYYGERGINFYEQWKNSFTAFYEYLMATIGAHPGGSYSIERIDNNKGYIPGNIKWATKSEQALNRRSRTKKVE